MKITWVKWNDSCTNGDHWQGKAEAKRFAKCKSSFCVSSGFVMHEDKKHLTLSLSFGPEGETRCQLIRIPKSAIVKRYSLGSPKKKK